jgi:hypothetical protein
MTTPWHPVCLALNAVIGKNRYGSDRELLQPNHVGSLGIGPFHQSCHGKFGGAVNGDKELKFAFGDVDMEITDGVCASWSGPLRLCGMPIG